MGKKNAQKIRQAKQQKRKVTKARKGPSPVRHEAYLTELGMLFLHLPELAEVRFAEEGVRQCLEELEAAVLRGLEQPDLQLGPRELALHMDRWMERLASPELALRARQGLQAAGAGYPELRKLADQKLLWRVVFLVSLKGIEPALRERAQAFFQAPRWPAFPLPEERLAEAAGCSVEDVLRMKAAVDSADHFADEPEYAELVKLRARLGAVTGGLTQEERERGMAALLVWWARRQQGRSLAVRLRETVPETAELPEVALAILGSYLDNGPDFLLMAPERPEWEIVLAQSCLREERPELAVELLEPLALAHPEMFDLRLLLTHCYRLAGREEEARAYASVARQDLERQVDSMDASVYQELHREFTL